MKKNFCIKFIALVCMCLTLNACHKEVITITSISNGADLVVENVTTGEQIENGGLQIGITRLIAHPGDVLESAIINLTVLKNIHGK